MAKKKVPQRGLQWSNEDVVELLAWLDHTINHDDIVFFETVVDHLKESRQKEFTIGQIENRLYRQWHRWSSDDPSLIGVKWRDGVLIHGSSCFVGLDVEAIALSVRELEEGYNSSHPFPSHRLRSRSGPAKSESNGHTNSEYSGTPRNKTPKRSRHRTQTLSLTPSAIKPEIDTIEKNSVPRKRKRTTPSRLLTPYTNVELGFQPVRVERTPSRNNTSRAASPHPTPIIHDSEEEEENEQRSKSISSVPENAENFELGPLLNCGPLDPSVANGTTEAPTQVYNTEFATAMADLKNQLQQQKYENRELRENVTTLQSEIEFLQSVQSQRDTEDGEPLHARIEGKDRTIKRLREELNDRRSLGTFTKLLPISRDWTRDDNGMADVVAGFQYIYSEIKQILYRYESDSTLVIPSLNRYESLRSLVSKGLDLDPQALLKIDKTVINSSKLSLQAVVRALTASALREWVFETDFPTFNIEASNVLNKYRQHLAEQDGANSLRKLDLAVKDSLVKGDHFRRTIPEKAENLAIQLSQTLAPLFTKNHEVPIEISWDGFATWGQNIEEWKERRVRLVDIFTKALEVKADSILNMLDYEMVIFPPQTKYDKNAVMVETMEGMVDYREHRGSRVELCIEAAVYAYQRRELQDSAPISEAIVVSTNFVRKEDRDRRGMRPIVKAVVILKEELLDGSEI